jgi:septum formation protein
MGTTRLSPYTNIVLASRSPRRQQILKEMGFTFTVAPQETPEVIRDKSFKKDIVTVTYEKLNAYPAKPGDLVIACDTIVVIHGRVLGKPADKEQAREYLHALAGHRHDVYSCLAIKCVTKNKCTTHHTIERTGVYFRDISSAEIEEYIDTPTPYDKAGGYAVQEAGRAFVKRINGCYYNVMGLPAAALLSLLAKIKGE